MLRHTRPITLAILAMGGEGGGVLSDWLVDLAEHNGYLVQTTSVPGVAQRTGATIYYLEMYPKAAADESGQKPVMALMPVPGDVDVVIASELMEAGRAVQRGLVTPDRTTLIASSHRVYAMNERLAMGDGRTDETAIKGACGEFAKRLIMFDMAAAAEFAGAIISAVMFGALAGAKVLPFPEAAFRESVSRGGVGVAASLRGFDVAAAAAQGGLPASSAATAPGEAAAANVLRNIAAEADAFPEAARAFVRIGIERMIDFQDQGYARLYLERLKPVLAAENASSGNGLLTAETARELALGMAYEDTIRVAELKIRASRFDRVREEAGAERHQILEIAEFLHPRLQEVAESVPAWLGRRILAPGILRSIVQRLTSRGRIIKTTSVSGFLMLYAVASLKPWRRASLRYASEQDYLNGWLTTVAATAANDYALAVEIALTRGLVKGYGDTHARGKARYEGLMKTAAKITGHADAAANLAALRKLASQDENNTVFDAALAAMQ